MEVGSNSPPPFLTKTYEMVDDSGTDSIVSWSNSGDSFVVWNTTIFSRDLLPKYFKHNNFSSFVRQLNTYGFRKIDPEQWEFANDDFSKGQKHLLNNIHRRKPVHSHSIQSQGNTSLSLPESERYELEAKIDKLKHEKGSILLDLNKHIEQQNGFDQQMHSLEEKMQFLSDRHNYIIEFLSNIVQIPGFLSNIVHQPDFHSKKRRVLMNDSIQNDSDEKQLQIENTLDLSPFEKMESTLNILESFFHSVSLASAGEMHHDFTTLPSDSHMVTSENAAANSTSTSPKLHFSVPCGREICSSLDLADSESYAENSGASSSEIHRNTARVSVSDIDVNSLPIAPEAHLPLDSANNVAGTSVPVGGNDVFWQQFFTETPGSDAYQFKSERKDTIERSDMAKADWMKFWWNRKNVDHLTEKIGHLTPAESA